jgi:glutamate-1-semialdehyde 2,1-aminomutase
MCDIITLQAQSMEVSVDRLPEGLEAELRNRRRVSADWWERGRAVIPSGSSGRRRAIPPHPFYSLRGEGSRLFDVDGNEYIDCTIGFGPVFLGHGHPVVTEAIGEAASRGTTFGTPHPDEVRFAEELVAGIPCAGQVIFMNTGSDATALALRVARVATGKPGVAKFEGGFHGTYDAVLGSFAVDGRSGPVEDPAFVSISNGSPAENLAHTYVLPFNHEAAFDKIRRLSDTLAIVMVEAVQGFGGSIVADPEWLRELSKVCQENDVLLMLDEIVTGFRVHPLGAQGWFGVDVDLATYGKVPGAGLPLGILAGTYEAMETLGTTGDFARDLVERAYFGGTYNAGTVAMATGVAVLRHLRDHPEIYPRLDQLGNQLRAGIADAGHALGIPLAVTGMASVWGVHFVNGPVRSARDLQHADGRARALLQAYLLAEGVFVSPTFGVLSAAHTDADIDRAVEAYSAALSRMQADGVLTSG